MELKPPSLGPTPEDMAWLKTAPWTKSPKEITASEVSAAQRLIRGARGKRRSQDLADVTRFMNYVRANRPDLAPAKGGRANSKRPCPKCGVTLLLAPGAETAPFHRPPRRSNWCKMSGKALGGAVTTADPKPATKVRSIAPEPAESEGRHPGSCPVCNARIAFDDADRMNVHRFRGYDATCVASYQQRGWVPNSLEEALPNRLRTGKPVSSKTLKGMRRVVGQLMVVRRDTERAAKRRARLATMTDKERRSNEVRYREVSGGAPGLGKRR